MLVVHAVWSKGALHLWGEDSSRIGRGENGSDGIETGLASGGDAAVLQHAAEEPALRAVLGDALSRRAQAGHARLMLPTRGGVCVPSPSAERGRSGAHAAGEVAQHAFDVPTVTLDAGDVAEAVARLANAAGATGVWLGPSVRFVSAASSLADAAIAGQRYVPMLRQDLAGTTEAGWHPWLSDQRFAGYVHSLVEAMPASFRAVVDENEHRAWAMLESFLAALIDSRCRRALVDEDLAETIRGREREDPHVALLGGLLDGTSVIEVSKAARGGLVKGVRRWLAGLEERGSSTQWVLVLRLTEPTLASGLPDLQAPGDDMEWTLSFHLRAADLARIELDAAEVWAMSSDGITIEGRRLDKPQETMLAELTRASRLFRPIESAMHEPEPTLVGLRTREAYQFLREAAPLLTEQGCVVDAPAWWDSPAIRIGARLHIDGGPMEGEGLSGTASAGSRGRMGLSSLVDYRWQLEIGGSAVTIAEFERLAASRSPLVRIGGRWVEVRPEDVRAAMGFMREHPGGQMTVLEAIRVAFDNTEEDSPVRVLGIEASGWVRTLLGHDRENMALADLEQPHTFHGTLRPYQKRGLSWLAFLERFGLGACLADDMGLGKTIQLLALMQREREDRLRAAQSQGAAAEQASGPTLLVVPTSVVGNWMHEAQRFCPELAVLVHHGPDRAQGEAFVRQVSGVDAVITTYSLAHRDRETFELVHWGRIVLDEAQFIKNASSKQAQAVRSLLADRRIALTGTPVENRLGELWSIMDFLNPGYLGGAATFRKRFAIPVERYRDQARAVQLRQIIQPFVLRRLKSDPGVISDLPEKIESREYAALTPEQAELYEGCVSRMLRDIEKSEGIQRRGMVLAGLIRLKQICNHPSQLLHDSPEGSLTPPDPRRSGKSVRLLEMLEEVLDRGEQALVFSQFRQMGSLIQRMIEARFKREALFLHGGVGQQQRDEIVRRFQHADGSCPVLIASLKAGGVGLNLTAANHVFHYDRWWNPAVENQATDRAYRIGQLRTVHVHKFVVSGTLEERIDEMIASKIDLAERIVGAGERWLTELDTDTLRSLLTLNHDAIEVASADR